LKAITAEEMKQLESFATHSGIPSRVLMEVAGMKVANFALHEIKRINKACVVCGSGGNGGDGFVAARYLHNAGVATEVFLTGNESMITSKDSQDNLAVLKKLGIKVSDIPTDLASFHSFLLASDIVIDAIFGISFHGPIDEMTAKIINAINLTKNEVKNKRPYFTLAIDVPSGTNATTGEAAASFIEADITVTFEYPKIGLMKYPANKAAGKIITTAIGIPRPNPIDTFIPHDQISEKPTAAPGFNVTDPKYVSAVIPRHHADANKGNKGHVLMVAGSQGMMGAAILASNAAMRTGSGILTLLVPKELISFANTMSLEVKVGDISLVNEYIKECNVVAVGPGLSHGKDH
jgi:hydroxyethylthiazole kinase-like uncharacterized protein yjeF